MNSKKKGDMYYLNKINDVSSKNTSNHPSNFGKKIEGK